MLALLGSTLQLLLLQYATVLLAGDAVIAEVPFPGSSFLKEAQQVLKVDRFIIICKILCLGSAYWPCLLMPAHSRVFLPENIH